MADKKRAPAKGKKPAAKKTTSKSSALETKTTQEEFENQNEEMEMDNHNQMEPQELRGNRVENGRQDTEEEHDDERQPEFHEPRTGNGVRPQDVRLSDEYTIESYFDKNQRLFVAMVVEYPELRCTGHTRDEAMVDLEERLEDHVYDLKARGGQAAEPMQSRQFPEKIELPLSQSLFRKLDQLSRHEKLPLDRLVSELLSAAVEKRGAVRHSQPQQHQHQHHRDREHHHGGGGGHHHNRHQGGGHRHQGGGGNRPQRGGGNYRALDSRENFMEYVRNLEKGGGPGWKKR